jgi:(p)ppGpp synthase/HD superfamily hydrolase
MADIERAIQIAVEAHSGQKDKTDRPYILHPLRVMLHMKTDTEMMAAVLHDVVEDSDWTLLDLRREGFTEEVINQVDLLSRRRDESYEEFIRRIKQNPLAVGIKLADLEDNMDLTRLAGFSDPDQERMKKYHAAWRYLKGYTDRP